MALTSQDMVIHADQWTGLSKPSLLSSFQAVALFPGSCCISASIAAGAQGRDQDCAWDLVVVAGGHQWCLSQRTGTNMQAFSLSLLWHSALPAQDFQLALRFCAIFGLTRGCYQMSLPLESCCKGRSYLVCHCDGMCSRRQPWQNGMCKGGCHVSPCAG